MIDEVLSKSEVQRYLTAMREHLAAGRLDRPAAAVARAIGARDADARTAVLARIPDPANLKQSPGAGAPFIARDPVTSLLQSTLDEKFREAGIVRADEQFELDVSASVLDRVADLAEGNHPFNPSPALHEITSDDARVIVVGDWGSGTPYALDVARLMRQQVEQASPRPVAVIHLGDVYNSGLQPEYDRNVLGDDCWPVPRGSRAGVTSWSLNGNHDMYSGAWCYFDYLLGRDARFANQRSADGKPTSFFRLRTPTWDLVGLDTAWHANMVKPGKPPGELGALEDPQATNVATWADQAEQTGRGLMLLSHHQFLSAFDPGIGERIGGTLTLASGLKDKLGHVLAAGRVRAWLWGHEHRCVGFEDFSKHKGIGIAYPRCIGHGGWYQLPPPGHGLPQGVKFLARATDTDGYLRRGFALLDFAANGSIAVSYYDDDDQPSPPPETFTRA